MGRLVSSIATVGFYTTAESSLRRVRKAPDHIQVLLVQDSTVMLARGPVLTSANPCRRPVRLWKLLSVVHKIVQVPFPLAFIVLVLAIITIIHIAISITA